MSKKVINHVGTNENMIISVEYRSWIRRLFNMSPIVKKYVGSDTIWYVLPADTRASITEEYWLTLAYRKIVKSRK